MLAPPETAAPALAKYQAWRSVYSIVSSYVTDERLRQALSFHTLLVGGNPMTTSAIYALIHKLEKDGGVWFAKGGTNALVAGMARHFQRLGGHLELNARVARIEVEGARATGVTIDGGRVTSVRFATSSGLGRYGPAMFSVHMIAHMMLSMMIPVLLVLGGPVTLALRALPPAGRGNPPGPREWIQAAIHSAPATSSRTSATVPCATA